MVTQLLALGVRLQQSGVDSAQNGATAASASGPSRPAGAEALSDSPASDLKRRRSFGSGLNAARNRRPGLGQRRDVAHLPLGAFLWLDWLCLHTMFICLASGLQSIVWVCLVEGGGVNADGNDMS